LIGEASIILQLFILVGHNLEIFDYLETPGMVMEQFRFTQSQMAGREYVLTAPGLAVMQ
jgi:hypothetical protein